MKQFIVLVGLLSVVYAALEESSFRPVIELRIAGGNKASIEDFPYQAALLRDRELFCGAVIIGPETILTAAHCVAPSRISTIRQLSFRVGSTKWRNGGKRIAARKLIIHELHEDCNECYDYDIAIVELAEKIDVPFAVPIPLAEENETFPDGTLATVSGWGTTISGISARSKTLRKVDVPLLNHTSCREAYESSLTQRFICAGSSRGPCKADSGGPLAYAGKLIGIVAFRKYCDNPKFPSAYSSIAKYRKWIRQYSGI